MKQIVREIIDYCEERFLILTFYRSLDPTECCTLTVHGSHTLIQIPSYLTQFLKENDQNSTWKSLHVNHAWEPHVNPDSFIFQTQFLTKKLSKFHLKIPARESQHCLQSNLSQIHSYHGVKRPKRKEIATCGKFVSPQQLLWASCCWHAQGISYSFCAIAIQQYTVQRARFTCSYRELHEMWHFSLDEPPKWNSSLLDILIIMWIYLHWSKTPNK